MKSDWLRYSCQMSLPGFDEEAQRRLSNASVLIVGAGGLGCPASQYLVSSGVGRIAIADFDTVSVSNLHRQILFTSEDIGKSKANVATKKLQSLNPDVHVISIAEQITSSNVLQLVNDYNVIVDCTDNIETKYLLNDACVIKGKPLVYGAIYQFDGQVAAWNVKNSDGSMSANYRDAFPDINAAEVPSCSEGGVLPTIAGIIGCMQATEVIKLLTGVGEVLSGKLLLLDGNTMRTKIISVKKQQVTIENLQDTIVPDLISVDEVFELLDKHEIELIDVREKEEHDKFNIGGVNVPLRSVETIELKSDRKIVLYCQSGKRSIQAAKIMMRRFPRLKIYSLREGLNAYDTNALRKEKNEI